MHSSISREVTRGYPFSDVDQLITRANKKFDTNTWSIPLDFSDYLNIFILF